MTLTQCGSPPSYCDCYDESLKMDKKQTELLTGIKNPYEEDIKLNYSLIDDCQEIYKNDNGIKSKSYSPKVRAVLSYFKEKCN